MWQVDVKLLGPFHEYVAPPVAVNLISVPTHTGLVDDAVAVGNGLTVTLAVAMAVHPLVNPITV